MTDSWLGSFDSWIQLGAFGVLAVVLIWLITRGFPNMLQKFDSMLTAQREFFRSELAEQRACSRQQHSEHLQTIARIGDNLQTLKRESHCVIQETRETLTLMRPTLEKLSNQLERQKAGTLFSRDG